MLYLRISIFILHFFSERHHDAMPFIYFCVKKKTASAAARCPVQQPLLNLILHQFSPKKPFSLIDAHLRYISL